MIVLVVQCCDFARLLEKLLYGRNVELRDLQKTNKSHVSYDVDEAQITFCYNYECTGTYVKQTGAGQGVRGSKQ